MYKRFELAVRAVEETDLLQLSMWLNEAVTECMVQGTAPHTDPAIMIMCYQIAFAGNGDVPDGAYYRGLLRKCQEKIDNPTVELEEYEPVGIAA